MFSRTPDVETAAAKWLRDVKWNAIFFSMSWRNIFHFNEPFFDNATLIQLLSFRRSVGKAAQEYTLTSIFPRTPDSQTAAAKWLPTLIGKKILYYIRWKTHSCRQPFLRIVSVDIMTTIDTKIIKINVSMFTTISYLLLDTIGMAYLERVPCFLSSF